MGKKRGNVLVTKVYVDEQSIKKRIEDLFDATTMLKVQTMFAKTINDFVPALNEVLDNHLEITSEYVRYVEPYAHYQYIGIGLVSGLPFNYTKDVHPLATSHWDEVAMQVRRDEFELAVKDILTRRAKELYG